LKLIKITYWEERVKRGKVDKGEGQAEMGKGGEETIRCAER